MDILLLIIIIVCLYISDIVTGLIRKVFEKIDDIKHKKEMEGYKKAREEGKPPATSKLYEDVEEMIEDIKSRRTKFEKFMHDNEILWWIRSFFWNRLLDHPRDLRQWIIARHQRANRGWADRDTWVFMNYLSGVIKGGLILLKKTKHGIPGDLAEKYGTDDKAFEKAEKEWDEIMDKMIWTFDTALKISEHTWIYQESSEFTNKTVKNMTSFCEKMKKRYPEDDYKVMTKEECIKYEEGWSLFQKYFFDLWD